MRQLLSSPPRAPTAPWQMSRKIFRRGSVITAGAGPPLFVLGIALRVPIPFCILGLVALIAAVVAIRAGNRRLELWISGTEMLAEARRSKAWTLTWCVDGHAYSEQTGQAQLLWAGGRARILVDLAHPSRMTPVGLEMLTPPESEKSPSERRPILPPGPRAPT